MYKLNYAILIKLLPIIVFIENLTAISQLHRGSNIFIVLPVIKLYSLFMPICHKRPAQALVVLDPGFTDSE